MSWWLLLLYILVGVLFVGLSLAYGIAIMYLASGGRLFKDWIKLGE